MYINTFKYTPKDVSCQLCTEYVKKLGCTALRCPWLAERIEAGVVGYREAVMETFPRDRRLSSRLNLLIKHYPGTAPPIGRTQPARKRLKPPSVTTTGITGWIQRRSLRWCSSSAMTARFTSLPSPSVKRTGTGAILPTTGLGQTPCPSLPIPTHGVLTATAIWPSTAIPVWSICFSARPAKPTRRSSRKPLSGTS